MAKISVIVPVYNVEKYLRQCLDSIVQQTFQDIEILVVNDGSTDNSLSIIEEYEKQFPTLVKCFTKENGGLSDARNFGVQQAKGEYLIFVDSDDYLDTKLFSTLVPYMQAGTEVIKYKLQRVNEQGNILSVEEGPVFENITGEKAFATLMGTDKMLEPAWLYLYKTSFFKEHEFEYAKGLYHEDFGLTPIIISTATTVTSVNFFGYYYRQRENSIVRNKDYKKTKKRAMDLLIHYDTLIQVLEKSNISRSAQKNLKQYYSNACILRIKELHQEDWEVYIHEIKQRSMIKNIKVGNLKQLFKKITLAIDIRLYLKLK